MKTIKTPLMKIEPQANAEPNALFEPPPIGQNRQYTCSAAVNKGRGALNIDGEIGYWGITAKMVRDRLDEIGTVDDLDVVVNSPGGLIGEGVAIYNALKKHAAKVHISIEGYALSMGSVIAMAGDTVSMADNSLMMIHNPIGGAWGDAETLRKEADVLDKHKTALISSYTGRPQVTMSDDEMVKAMNDETWYTAQEAREVGLVDTVVQMGDESINKHAAMLPSAAVQNAPDWVKRIRDRAIAMATTQPASVGTKTPEDDMNIAGTKAAGADTAAEGETESRDKPVDVAAIGKAAVKEDLARQKGIRAEFASRAPGAPVALIERYIDQGLAVSEVTNVITDMLEFSGDTTPVGGDAIVTADESDKAREGMTNALMARMGKDKKEPGNEFNGMTLYEMAGESLRRNGVKSFGSKAERVGAAFTHSTSDFPTVLEDVTRKTLMDSYAEREESFEQYTRVGSLPDFRQAKRVGLTEFDELDRRPEGAEYKHKTFGEYSEVVSLDTYGNKVAVTREMIINDDLGAFTDIATRMGRMAKRTVAGKVFDVFAANPLMNDGNAWLSAAHGNVKSEGRALSTESVDAALTAMALNKGRNADNDSMQPLNIIPNILLVPMALRSRAMTVMQAEYRVHEGATDSSRDPNTVRNAMQVIADPRLDAISAVNWFMISSEMAPIERSYLDGQQEPYLDSIQGWDIDGTEFKIRLDFGVAPVEYTSIYRQTGA